MTHPSDKALAQAFVERFERRYTPLTVRLVMEEVTARARELDAEKGGEVAEWETHWKVGEFRSSHTPDQIVLVLSVGNCIAHDEQHHSFVRWVYSHPVTPPAQAAEADPVQAATSKAVHAVMAQREEIVRAFVAKYGFQPDEAMQVSTPNGWYITRRVQAAEAENASVGAWIEALRTTNWDVCTPTDLADTVASAIEAAIGAMGGGK